MNIKNKDINKLNQAWEQEQEEEHFENRVQSGCLVIILIVLVIFIIKICN